MKASRAERAEKWKILDRKLANRLIYVGQNARHYHTKEAAKGYSGKAERKALKKTSMKDIKDRGGRHVPHGFNADSHRRAA